ncbi:MAG: hypothetical protein KDJ36_05765 [Hyphomicrobiaceae bacterium]|nr:hypothetical protein [Hyphomicrobiaceae bacterium]
MMPLLLSPHQLAAKQPVRQAVTQTARAFRMGPQLHPNRAAWEFYPTPPSATHALLNAERFNGSIWEPACGQGHISKVLEAHGYGVHSTDLVNHGYGSTGHDFLEAKDAQATNIVTNPPYGRGLADAFLRHALELTAATGGKVAFLCAIQSLCHPLRHGLYTANPPAVIYALDDCQCWPNGVPQPASSAIAKQRYCWMVWLHGHQGGTRFEWLTTG